MDEQTVNEELDFTASDFEADQTVEEGEAAVEETNEQSATDESQIDSEAVSQNETQTNDDIDSFIAKKGVKLDDPDAVRKIAGMYQNAEKKINEESQARAKLERQIANSKMPQVSQPQEGLDAGQEALIKLRGMEIENATKAWKESKNLTPEAERKMMGFLEQEVNINGHVVKRAFLVANGVMSLEEAYILSGCATEKSDNLKKEYREQVKKEIAARQAATRPAANATNSTQFGKPQEESSFLDGLREG